MRTGIQNLRYKDQIVDSALCNNNQTGNVWIHLPLQTPVCFKVCFCKNTFLKYNFK